MSMTEKTKIGFMSGVGNWIGNHPKTLLATGLFIGSMLSHPIKRTVHIDKLPVVGIAQPNLTPKAGEKGLPPPLPKG